MKVYILGAGGFAREVVEVLLNARSDMFYQIAYLSDDLNQIGSIIGFHKVESSIENVSSLEDTYFFPGIGSPSTRKKLVERALKKGLKLYPHPLIHDTSFVGSRIDLGLGTVICSNSSITCDISIGRFVNVNLNCTIGHDAILEDYVNLSPGVNVSGYVYIEEDVDIGTGAVILPKIRIGKGSVIGANSTVTKDIPPYSLAYGSPAKIVRNLKE